MHRKFGIDMHTKLVYNTPIQKYRRCKIYTELIQKICELKKISSNSIAKPKRGGAPDVSYYQLIYAILTKDSLEESAEVLPFHVNTLKRLLHKIWPEVKSTGAGHTWSYILLLSIGYKKCPKCNEIKLVESFYKDVYNSCRKRSICIPCDNSKTAEYRKENLESCKDRIRQHYKDNPQYYISRNARHRADKLCRTPSWAELTLIKEFYSRCPEGYHVDHKLPLQGGLVSGLHVIDNLQYLSVEENLSKSNNFDITKFNSGDFNTEKIVWPV